MSLQTIPIILLILSSFFLVLFLGWRYALLALALQYVGVF